MTPVFIVSSPVHCKHQLWTGRSSLVQKNMQCSTKWHKLTEGDKKQMEYHQKFCGSFLYKILTSTDQEESKANQCKNIIHCQLGYTHILSRHHVTSYQTASRKTSHGTTESSRKPEIHTSCTKSYCFHYHCVFYLLSWFFSSSYFLQSWVFLRQYVWIVAFPPCFCYELLFYTFLLHSILQFTITSLIFYILD